MVAQLHKFTKIMELYTYKFFFKEQFQNFYFNGTFFRMGKI